VYDYGKGGDITKQPDTMTSLQIAGSAGTTGPAIAPASS
jgi:hypothetical protein